MKITFFYSPQEVDEYLRHRVRRGSTDNELFIAMTPLAYSRLDENGESALNTLGYFTNDSHMRLLEKSKALMDWFRINACFVDPGVGVREAVKDSFIFWIRCTVHYCLWTIEVVLNAVEKHKPDVLSASSSGKRKIPNLLISPEEKYLSHIVNTISRVKGLGFEDISKAKATCNNISHFLLFSYMAPLFKYIARFAKFLLWERGVLIRRMFTPKRPFVFTVEHNMGAVVREFQKKNPRNPYYFLEGPVVPSFNVPDFLIRIFWRPFSDRIVEQKTMFERLERAISEEKGLFSYRDVPFADIISQKIKDNIAGFVSGLMLWSVNLDRFIERSRPEVFISDGNRIDDMVLAQLCRDKGIESVLFSHGSLVRPKNEFESIEWKEQGNVLMNSPFSRVALQSPLSEGYLDVFPSTASTVKTGPLVWGRPIDLVKSKRLFSEMFKGKYDFEKTKVVLHAGTPKPSIALRLYVYETPDEYIRDIRELAEAVQKIPDAILIVRFRRKPEMSTDALKRIVPFSEKVILSVEESFADVLGMSDLLISFSSTAIEEALQNRMPVLLYGGGGRYQHIPAREIRAGDVIEPKAIYHVEEKESLEYAVTNILNLNINSKQYAYLFEPYIYAKEERVSIAEIVNVQPITTEHKI